MQLPLLQWICFVLCVAVPLRPQLAVHHTQPAQQPGWHHYTGAPLAGPPKDIRRPAVHNPPTTSRPSKDTLQSFSYWPPPLVPSSTCTILKGNVLSWVSCTVTSPSLENPRNVFHYLGPLLLGSSNPKRFCSGEPKSGLGICHGHLISFARLFWDGTQETEPHHSWIPIGGVRWLFCCFPALSLSLSDKRSSPCWEMHRLLPQEIKTNYDLWH